MKKLFIGIIILLGLSGISSIYINMKDTQMIEDFSKLFINERLDDIYLSDFMANHIINESIELDMDPILILSIIEVESTFRNIFGDGGHAVGFMQIHEAAAWYVSTNDQFIQEKYSKIGNHDNLIRYPGLQISIGMRYLKHMQERSDFVTGISMYNGRKDRYNVYSNKVLKVYNDIISQYLLFKEYSKGEMF
jgi:hypothetical protein